MKYKTNEWIHDRISGSGVLLLGFYHNKHIWFVPYKQRAVEVLAWLTKANGHLRKVYGYVIRHIYWGQCGTRKYVFGVVSKMLKAHWWKWTWSPTHGPLITFSTYPYSASVVLHPAADREDAVRPTLVPSSKHMAKTALFLSYIVVPTTL